MVYEKEYSYLIHLLRCAINGDIPRELPEGMSFSKVYQYAMEHDVANLAFYAVEKMKNFPESSLYETWAMRRDLALVRDMHQSFAHGELAQSFAIAEIPFKELQGTVLKKFYPRTEYRTMSDLDFIVEDSRLEECYTILKDLGYRVSRIGTDELVGFRDPDIVVEIHTDYFSHRSDYYGLMDLSFSETPPTDIESATELYLYNILHVAKHYFAGGCGIRRVLDVYYLDRFCADKIDRAVADEILKKADLTSFSRELSALGRQWFADGVTDKTTAAMEQYIFQSGTHGKRENYIHNKISRGQKGKYSTFYAKAKYLISRVFPGDRVMLRNYPVLQKSKILYPLCWCHRIVAMLLGKNRKACFRDMKLIFQTKQDLSIFPPEKK